MDLESRPMRVEHSHSGGGGDDQREAGPDWQHHLLPHQLRAKHPVLQRQPDQPRPQHLPRSASVGDNQGLAL